MTVIDPLLEPRRARRIVFRALLNYALPLIGLPIILLLTHPSAAALGFALCLALDRGRRPVEVWDALERPSKRERRRGIRSAEFLRFWAERAGWPVERTLRVRHILRAATAMVYLTLGAWTVYDLFAARR